MFNDSKGRCRRLFLRSEAPRWGLSSPTVSLGCTLFCLLPSGRVEPGLELSAFVPSPGPLSLQFASTPR